MVREVNVDFVLESISQLIEQREIDNMHYRHSLERFLHLWEIPIRDAMKRFYAGNRFSLAGTLTAQSHRNSLLEDAEYELPDGSVHDGWHSLDKDRRTAACLLEQQRARIWALGQLFVTLAPHSNDMHFVTYAKPSHQKRDGNLHRFNASNYRRTIEGALRQVHRDFPDLTAIGTIEISARPTLKGATFEPHCHLLVHGVPEQPLRSALAQLANGASRAVMILPVRTLQQLGERLSYLFKFIPESRVLYERADGRTGHGHNLMTGEVFAEWLAWLSRCGVDELLITHGFSRRLRREFRETEMKVLVGALIESSRQMPPRG
ncbi:hypothetical protein [Sinorhizobium sp. M4_45]|uniref:hypothetical protein n=1 Tax=Sinorhizobium sp. M4_45 TaxID=2037901 RepID=UPI000C9CCF96|nr:hypothetical protein [Sinorhizobium sp. M4_45]PND27037.1 hypothetical protein CN933_15115 [Sinorhizobium sp. M4_45]